jgi:hypothetical protein
MRPITEHICYDRTIQLEYHRKKPLCGPSLFLEPGLDDWAIIPTHRGKSYHDLFYSNSGLPKNVAAEFLKDDIIEDRGYALIYKRVIGLHAQNGLYYKNHKPYYVDFRENAIWGDYYYAGLYECLLHALQNGCKRLAFFATHGSLMRWQWCALIRAAHNAKQMYSSDGSLSICDISIPELQQFSLDEEKLPIPPHHEPDHVRLEEHAEGIDFLSFIPNTSATSNHK